MRAYSEYRPDGTCLVGRVMARPKVWPSMLSSVGLLLFWWSVGLESRTTPLQRNLMRCSMLSTWPCQVAHSSTQCTCANSSNKLQTLKFGVRPRSHPMVTLWLSQLEMASAGPGISKLCWWKIKKRFLSSTLLLFCIILPLYPSFSLLPSLSFYYVRDFSIDRQIDNKFGLTHFPLWREKEYCYNLVNYRTLTLLLLLVCMLQHWESTIPIEVLSK